jgi:hypothetical protein
MKTQSTRTIMSELDRINNFTVSLTISNITNAPEEDNESATETPLRTATRMETIVLQCSRSLKSQMLNR